MSVWQRSIRGIVLVILAVAPLAAVSLHEERSYAALYLSSPEYRSFLLENWKKQAEGPTLRALGEKVPQSLWEESAQVGRLISLRATPGEWTEKQVRELSLYIVLKSREYDLSPMLVLSLIEVESRFRNHAISPRGARGLMQLMPTTAAGLAEEFGLDWAGADALSDPKVNIDLALRYLHTLKARFQTPQHVLTAYNIGPAALEKMLKNGETPSLAYYKKVMKAMKGYQKEAGGLGKASAAPATKTAWL